MPFARSVHYFHSTLKEGQPEVVTAVYISIEEKTKIEEIRITIERGKSSALIRGEIIQKQANVINISTHHLIWR